LLFDVFDMLERYSDTAQSDLALEQDMTSDALARFDRPSSEAPPEIIFPRNGVEVFLSSDRGFALAARGGSAGYRWYVNGEPLRREKTSGRAVWRPDRVGFYDVAVVDKNGRIAKSKVRVVAG